MQQLLLLLHRNQRLVWYVQRESPIAILIRPILLVKSVNKFKTEELKMQGKKANEFIMEPSFVKKRFLEMIIGSGLKSIVEEINVAASLQRSDIFLEEFPLVTRLLL